MTMARCKGQTDKEMVFLHNSFSPKCPQGRNMMPTGSVQQMEQVSLVLAAVAAALLVSPLLLRFPT